jgi:hypothetical protein
VTWGRYSVGVGVFLLITAGARLASNGDVADLLLLVGGAVLLPAWLIWTGNLLSARASRHAVARQLEGAASDSQVGADAHAVN